jgi:hypothetical protein
MAAVYLYSFVEDAPSAAVAKKLVAARNAQAPEQLCFREGFPAVTGGYGAIKKRCKAFLKMAKLGIYTFTLTDLDTKECACSLIRMWFGILDDSEVSLPDECIFRVAVREIESWILADRAAWAKHIGIPVGNFSTDPDSLPDPKQHLLNVLRRKGTKKVHREMLPVGTAHIGPRYNEVLCDFVEKSWSPERAAMNSPSLNRAIQALLSI